MVCFLVCVKKVPRRSAIVNQTDPEFVTLAENGVRTHFLLATGAPASGGADREIFVREPRAIFSRFSFLACATVFAAAGVSNSSRPGLRAGVMQFPSCRCATSRARTYISCARR